MSILPKPDPRNLELIFSSFNLGFIALSLQVVFARLAVGFAGGNEVYLSIFFFFWLMFTGAGAFLIKKINPRRLFLLLCLMIPISATIFFISPRLFGIMGQELVPPHIFIITIAIALFPICFLNGALFSSVAFQGKGEGLSSRTYWGEAVGALGGGVITTLFYVCGGRDFTLLILIIAVCLAAAFRIKILKYLIFGAGLFGFFLGMGDPIENELLRFHYRPYHYIKSVSGRLIRYDIVKSNDIATLYSGGIKVADFPDDIAGKEIFYWLYMVKPDMKDIAFVGAEYHMVDKLVPPNIKRVYVYPDNDWRSLLDKSFLPPEDNTWVTDPVAFFKNNPRKFDAISVSLGPLLSFYDYRLETKRFIGLCRLNLAAGGVFSLSVPAYDGLWPNDLRSRLSIIYANLKRNFADVQLVPGSNVTFLCSDSLGFKINAENLCRRYDELGFNSSYFNCSMINSRLNDLKVHQAQSQLAKTVSFFEPMTIGYGLSYYFSQFGIKYGFKGFVNVYTILALLSIIVALTLLFGNIWQHKSLTLLNIFYFGAGSFILEMTAMFHIQLLGGYMYVAMGLIIGLYMAGMVFGSFWGAFIVFKNKYLKLILNSSLIPYFLFAILSLACLVQLEYIWFWMAMAGMAGVAGGLGYSINARVFDNRPGLPYGIDMSGAMVGTVVVAALLIGTISYFMIYCVMAVSGLLLFATNWRSQK
ncbi:MAG: hypothetical protein GX409_07385 [candidate division Zixibacteria bacterium]|nr:hypothetical protein [candidate division Zixibacteria bacterium]